MRKILGVLTFAPLVMPVVFALIFVPRIFGWQIGHLYDYARLLFIASIGVCLALIPYYLWRVRRNPRVEHQGLWILLILCAPQVAMPFYFVRYETDNAKREGHFETEPDE